MAIGAHIIGAVGLLIGNRERVFAVSGVRATSTAKAVLTAAALAATVYSGYLGRTTAQDSGSALHGSTEPGPATPEEVAAAQHRLRTVQWIIPSLTGALVALGALQGEQQKPRGQVIGAVRTLAARASA